MTAPRPSKTHIGNHRAASRNADAELRLRPDALGRRGQAAGVPDLDLRVQHRRGRPRLLRLRLGPQAAAGRHRRRPRLFALQSSQQRDRRGPAGDLRGRGSLHPVLVRHVGDRDHDPRLRPAGRRDPAFAAALRRHRDTAVADAGAVRHRRGRLRRWRQRSRRSAAAAAEAAQAKGRISVHPDRDAGQPDQHPGRHRADRGASPTRSAHARATARSWSATTRCSVRCFSIRSNTAPTCRSTR